MKELDELWSLEEKFWLDGVELYRQRMHQDAVMLFPEPTGIIQGSAVLETLQYAPRWDSVEFDEKSAAVTGDTAVLAYRAVGVRNGSDPYKVICSSAFSLENDQWMLVSHQQMPFD